ncbi:ethylene-responsive transcription factor ERF014-like [Typha angustifolia]|uniref:ethylene-responsive transcription factor ERF014-like n=1 Tax=Typha angustifolia TaxID=59011 RepID=UPI003C2DADBE
MVKSSGKVLQSPQNSMGAVHSNHHQSAGSNGKRQYKGVRMRSWGSWVSEIRAPNQKARIWLGSYSTAEAAARAYDAALLCIKGSSASFNFPPSLPYHLPAAAMSPKSIQRVAAAAAANATANAIVNHPQSSLPPSPYSNTTADDTSATSLTEELVAEESLNESLVDLEAFFQSPKCMDYMLSACNFFAPAQIEDWEEEGEISLWSFC